MCEHCEKLRNTPVPNFSEEVIKSMTSQEYQNYRWHIYMHSTEVDAGFTYETASGIALRIMREQYDLPQDVEFVTHQLGEE